MRWMQGGTRADVLRVMRPTSVARWGSEQKRAGGTFLRSDTPQSKENKSQSVIATKGDYATGEGKQTQSVCESTRRSCGSNCKCA